MELKTLKTLATGTLLSIAFSANAVPVLFHGSSDPTLGKTVAQARAEWAASLASFSNDTLTSTTGGATSSPPPFTSAAGNTYSETGNGSTISLNSGRIQGLRNSAPRIEFDVAFQAFVNAAGFDVNDNDGGGMALLLTDAFTGLTSTFNFTSTPGSGDDEFFGVVFDTTTFVSRLRVSGTDPGGVTSWDNFSTGIGRNVVINPNNPVSAPGTLFLAALGMAAIWASRNARRA